MEHINPQIAKLSRNLRTGWYIFGVSNSPKMVYFRVWDSDQHSDPTITLPLESPPRGTSSDIEKWSMAFFPILSDLTSETNMFLGWTFPLRLLLEENSHFCWNKKWNCWILRNACWKIGYFCTVIGRAVWCDTCKRNFAHLFSGSSFMLKILGLMQLKVKKWKNMKGSLVPMPRQ